VLALPHSAVLDVERYGDDVFRTAPCLHQVRDDRLRCPAELAGSGQQNGDVSMSNEIISSVLAVSAIVIGITAVAAQPDVIAARKSLMKEIGVQATAGAAMAKGQIPYDQAKAQAIFATYVRAAEDSTPLYPATSKTGGDTAALPAIWANKPDFDERLKKFVNEAKVARYQAKDLDGFKWYFTQVMKNCGGCHEPYRARKG
jgi:cytochrome c556